MWWPWTPGGTAGRTALAGAALAAVVGGGYAAARSLGDAQEGGPRPPYHARTRLLCQALAVPGSPVHGSSDGLPLPPAYCIEEDAVVLWLQLATPLMAMSRYDWRESRVRFRARDEAGRRYALRTSRFEDFGDGILILYVLRGYAQKPKRLTVSALIGDKVEASWTVKAVPTPQRVVLPKEPAHRLDGARLSGTRHPDLISVSLPVSGTGERTLMVAPTRTTYCRLRRRKLHVHVPRRAPVAEFDIMLPNAAQAREVELAVDAYEWHEETDTVVLSGAALELRDGEPVFTLPEDRAVKSARGWDVHLMGEELTERLDELPKLQVEIIWNRSTSSAVASHARAFDIDVLSPRPESLGLRAYRLRARVADDGTGDYRGSVHRRIQAAGRPEGPLRLGPLGPVILRITRRYPKLLFSRRLMLAIPRTSA